MSDCISLLIRLLSAYSFNTLILLLLIIAIIAIILLLIGLNSLIHSLFILSPPFIELLMIIEFIDFA